MEDLLYLKSFHQPMFDVAKPNDNIVDNWTLLQRSMCRYIRQWVNDNLLDHISEESNAKSLWDKFDHLYAKKTSNNKMYLIKKMLVLKLQEQTLVI